MKKTMNINIAGQLFRIDEDAYEILTRYLEHVATRFRSEQGGDETLADIESRIAEIFGGGNEPPSLVSKEMVDEMINIMGAPEDYYDNAAVSQRSTTYTRRSMYDPNSLSARFGKALSEFFRAFGRVMSVILRVFAFIIGTLFTIIGFLLLFASVLVLFFNNAPLVASVMDPEIMNTHTLLSIVLNSNVVWPVIILTALVVLLPLASLTYLGIKLIFNIRYNSRIFGMIMFVIWIASACALGVILGLQLSVYSTSERVEERIALDTPVKTVWLAPMNRISDTSYDETAYVEDVIKFYMNSSTGQLRGSVDLNIYGSDTTSGWISVEKIASSNSEREAWQNAREISFNWKFSGDTLYLDDYFSLPAGNKWYGSHVDIDIRLPEGSEVRCVPGSSFSTWMFGKFNPGSTSCRVVDGYLEEIKE
ncbi:MAG: hypothetical protein MUC78_03055 [Bacteroidales bacterium]|jgi:hypothetical protein|nr:hypothetical protein [Bacteroidales bacterium]